MNSSISFIIFAGRSVVFDAGGSGVTDCFCAADRFVASGITCLPKKGCVASSVIPEYCFSIRVSCLFTKVPVGLNLSEICGPDRPVLGADATGVGGRAGRGSRRFNSNFFGGTCADAVGVDGPVSLDAEGRDKLDVGEGTDLGEPVERLVSSKSPSTLIFGVDLGVKVTDVSVQPNLVLPDLVERVLLSTASSVGSSSESGVDGRGLRVDIN